MAPGRKLALALVCQEKITTPNFVVLILCLLKLCLYKDKQTPWQGQKNYRDVKRGVKANQERRRERDKSFQGSAIKIERAAKSCLFLPLWFYQ